MDFKFSPQPVQAKVGQVIGWKNDDSAGHTATLADDSCGTDTIASGSTGALVFNVAGTYTYKCAIHPTQMKDYTVVVS
jgi:plastocyanin